MGDEERYSRQIRFASIGMAGQRRLGEAVVLVAGTGSLGASLAQHMARAGVGELRLADRDYVEQSNLQRQILFDEEDARQALPKAEAAARKLRTINSSIAVKSYACDLAQPGILESLADGCDLILDGTDNVETRLLLSDYSFRHGIPFLYGGVAGAAGMSAALVPGTTCCLRCLVGGEEESEGGDTCETAGMISPAVELISALQAVEALKWLSGARKEMRDTLVRASLWPYSVVETKLPGPVPDCPVCGEAGSKGMKAGIGGDETDSGSEPGTRDEAGVATGKFCVEDGAVMEAAMRDEAGAAAGAREHEAVSATQARGGRLGSVAMAWERESGSAALARSAAAAWKHEAVAVAEAWGPARTAVLCGRDTVQLQLRPADPAAYAARLEELGCALTRNPYLLRALLPDGRRLVIFPDGRVLAQGTGSVETAWELCREYLGATGAGEEGIR